MSFLPFVLSFLLILVLASSTLFNSFRSTSIEKKIILAQSKARLSLINLQEKKKIDQLPKMDKKKDEALKTERIKTLKTKPYSDPRHERRRYEASKLNLSILWTKSDPTLYQIVYETAIRLLEILYQNADFYRETPGPNLARTLLNALLEKKGDSFLDLFPTDPQLAKIYYKMLKGTNTGYPALEEYFSLTTENHPPVRFRYASAPLLEAVLGKPTAAFIMNEEKIAASKPGSKGILTHEQLLTLLQKEPSPLLSTNHLTTVFSFTNRDKGDPRAFLDPETQIMAER